MQKTRVYVTSCLFRDLAAVEQLTSWGGGGGEESGGGGGPDELVQIPIPDSAYALSDTPPQKERAGPWTEKGVPAVALPP